jgi:branched-chain amino acid transport system substrate-binding protein
MATLGAATESGFLMGAKEFGPQVAGRPYTIIREDDAGDPAQGLSKARKLVEKDAVDVIVGTVSSAVAAAIRNYVVDAKRLWLNPIATNDLLAEQGCSRYHFRFSASGWQIAGPLGPWGKAKLGDRAYVIVTNYAYGQQTGAHFKETFRKAGGTIVGEAFAALGTTNYAPYFPPIKDARPAFIFANFVGSDAVAFIKQYAEFGLKDIKVVGPVNLVSEDVLFAQGPAAAGVYSISYYTPSYDIPKNRQFVRAYKEFSGGKETDHFVCAGYDVAQALFPALAALKGETSNTERLIAQIQDTKIDSPRGPFRFDPKTHNPIQDQHMRIVEANPLRHVVVDTIKDARHPEAGCHL